MAIPTIVSVAQSLDGLAFLITQPDRPAGRGRVLTESPVAQWARENEIQVFKPASLDETLELVKGLDLLLTIGYGVLFPKEILDAPKHGCLNLHFSVLPRWRGAAPVQRAIEAGDAVSGVTVFKLDEGMDTGPIYSVRRFALDSDITSDELFLELATLGVEAVDDSLQQIREGKAPKPQPSSGVTRALKLSKAEGQIDWQRSADEIARKIRAFTSSPGAWTKFREQVIKVEAPKISAISLEPGLLYVKDKRLLVGTGTVALEIGAVTPSGKSRVDSSSWINGIRLEVGERFG